RSGCGTFPHSLRSWGTHPESGSVSQASQARARPLTAGTRLVPPPKAEVGADVLWLASLAPPPAFGVLPRSATAARGRKASTAACQARRGREEQMRHDVDRSIGGVGLRVHLDEVHGYHLRIGDAPVHRTRQVADRHSPGSRARTAGGESNVEDVDVHVDVDAVAVAQAGHRLLDDHVDAA